jgi:peroxiredoxin
MAAEIGQPAPEFTLKDQNGNDVSLADFRGKQSVALVFYPFTFTGVCEGELCQLRDDHSEFEQAGVQVLAVSCDSRHAQRVWAEQQGYNFPVLSDFWPHGAVAQAYGVFNDDAGFANRGTFVVDRAGIVRFAEMKQPGEPRDQAAWTDALAAIRSD